MGWHATKVVKLIAILVGSIAAILFALKLIGVEIVNYPPDRPQNIPADTEWAGGLDSGVWVKCFEVIDSSPQEFACDIYAENGSCLLTNEHFQPFKVTWDSDNNRPNYEETRIDKPDYSYWDGQVIRLRQGVTLKSLN